jgi:hypothetical protein
MANEDSLGKALTKVIIYSVIFVVAMGIVQWFFTGGLQMLYSITGISAIFRIGELFDICYYPCTAYIWMVCNSFSSINVLCNI